ncbi:MAG: GNAT family N-acetyltransferase [Oscillospiraceae bacterium]
MIRIELLSETNFNENSLDSYTRTQTVKKVYRKSGTEYALVEMPYTEDWDAAKKRQVARELLSGGYISYGAFDGERVIGFIGLYRKLKGSFMILELMQVSAEYRGKGIGRRLFELGREEAKKAGADALYISACSSEETVGFYKAMGAVITDAPIREIADDEPFDVQMVCRIG